MLWHLHYTSNLCGRNAALGAPISCLAEAGHHLPYTMVTPQTLQSIVLLELGSVDAHSCLSHGENSPTQCWELVGVLSAAFSEERDRSCGERWRKYS